MDMEVVPGGQEDNRNLPGFQFRQQCKAVFSGEHHVQECQVVDFTGQGRFLLYDLLISVRY